MFWLVGFYIFIHNLFTMFSSAKARNSSFGFSALAYVSAKTKCAVCAAGFIACVQRPAKRSSAMRTKIQKVEDNDNCFRATTRKRLLLAILRIEFL